MRFSIQHGLTACNVRLSAPCIAGHAPELTINGAAFTGEFKLVRKATGYEKGRRPIGTWVRRLREPTFPVPFDRISDPQIPLTRPNRALAACVVDSPGVQAGLKRMLGSYDAEARAERSCDSRCSVIEELLSLSHTQKDAKVYVGEVTKAVEEIQTRRGETGVLEPRQIGDVRRWLGIYPKRDRQGFSIVLTENLCLQIHEIAADFEVALEEGEPCSLCVAMLTGPGPTRVENTGTEETNGK